MSREHAPPQTKTDARILDGAGFDPSWTGDQPEQAYATIEKFARDGRGTTEDILAAAHRLDRDHKQKVWELIPKLEAWMPGDQLLECAVLVNYTLDFALESALDARPPITAAKLRAFLRERDASELAVLDRNTRTIATLRRLLPGPVGLQLPVIGQLSQAHELHDKPNLVRWYLETTSPLVAAMELTVSANTSLAQTIDALDAWAWLDGIGIGSEHGRGEALRLYRTHASRADIQAKLDSLLARHEPDHARAQAARPAAHAELVDQLGRTGDSAELLDTAARAGYSRDLDGDAAKRLGRESPSTILQYALATSMSLERSIPLLVNAGGSREELVALVCGESDLDRRMAALTVSTVRAQFRRAMGRDFALRTLLRDDADLGRAHLSVIQDEALRHWAYEDKDPRTLLWLAAGGGENTSPRMTCALVGREKGFGWVEQLPHSVPKDRLHRFVLNCTDARATKHVRDVLLAERAITADATEDDVQATDQTVYGNGVKARLDVAVVVDDVPAAQVVSRIADMTLAERAQVVAEPGTLKRLVGKLGNEPELLDRALYLLGPSITQVLALGLSRQPTLVSYLRTRPAEEEAVALASAAQVKQARALFGATSPFLVFPSLHDAQALSRALDRNPGVLDWMLEQADADLVLTCLARPGVRERATAILESDPSRYRELPLYRHLSKRGKQSLEQLTEKLDDDDAIAEAESYVEDDGPRRDPAAQRGEAIASARKAGSLWEAIDRLRETGSDAAGVLAVIRAYPDDQIAFLGGSHPDQVRFVRGRLGLPPQHVFPALDITRLLSLPDARVWLLEYERPYLVLGLVAKVGFEAVKQLATYLVLEPATAFEFFRALPRGADLTPVEQRVIDELRGYVVDERLLELLFEVRFGSKVEGATFTSFDVQKLWSILSRLPASHVNQEVIRSYVEREPEHFGGSALGYWDGEDVVLKDELEGKDKMYEKGRTPVLTADEVKRFYGLEGEALDKAAGKGGFLVRVGDNYRVRQVEVAQFDATVLHEVGHAVDTMLGDRTDLVYGQGGWRVYGIDQVDEWARDMGGLDNIPGSDRTKIVEAWRRSLRSGAKINSLVDELHPALSDKYDHSPLIQAARDGVTFDYNEPLRAANGRVWITGNNQGYLCSAPEDTAAVAPSRYAMSAPAEFFAECYVEYYRGYDGTPTTADKKGGRLATWIRRWFDEHVDTIRLAPQRVRKADDAPPPTAPAAPDKRTQST